MLSRSLTRAAHALAGSALLLIAPLSSPFAQAAPRSQASPRPVWPDEGPATWAPRPTTADITANDLRTRLYGFAHDSMMGRRIGEPGNAKGTEYIASEFRRLGLRPAGDNGTYFQVLPYGPIGFDPAASRLVVDGAPARIGTEWIPAAPAATNSWGARADWTNTPTVFAGRWGDTVTLDPALFRGKVAVFLAPPSTNAAGGRGPASFVSCADVPNKFGADAAMAVEAAAPARQAGGRAGGAGGASRDMRLLRAGAIGVLVIGLDDMTRANVQAALTPRMTMQPATPAQGAAAATISRDLAARIFGAQPAQLAIGTTGKPVAGSWDYAWRPSSSPARNVIAVLPGSDPRLATQYVLVGAHNDHVGVNNNPVDHDSLRAVNTVTRRQGANDPACIPTADQQRRIDSLIRHARSIRPPRRDSIMNGADDDGSGTVVMLEIAEKFATEKPARSIIFISHQGEEAGLLGSRWFVDHPTVPLDSIVAAHNMDMVGKGRVDQVVYGGPNSIQMLGARRLSREFGNIIDSVNAVRSEPMAIDKSWDVPGNPMNRFCRSDQVNYVSKDIPVTYFSLGYAQDYHMATDEPQYIDYDHAARVGRFVHDIMMAIAMRKDRPAIAGPDPTMPRCGR